MFPGWFRCFSFPHFLYLHQVLGGASDFGGERWEDPIVKPALVAQAGQIVWDPNPPRPGPPGPPADTNGVSGFGGASPTPMPPPEETNAIIAWIQDTFHHVSAMSLLGDDFHVILKISRFQ